MPVKLLPKTIIESQKLQIKNLESQLKTYDNHEEQVVHIADLCRVRMLKDDLSDKERARLAKIRTIAVRRGATINPDLHRAAIEITVDRSLGTDADDGVDIRITASPEPAGDTFAAADYPALSFAQAIFKRISDEINTFDKQEQK